MLNVPTFSVVVELKGIGEVLDFSKFSSLDNNLLVKIYIQFTDKKEKR